MQQQFSCSERINFKFGPGMWIYTDSRRQTELRGRILIRLPSTVKYAQAIKLRFPDFQLLPFAFCCFCLLPVLVWLLASSCCCCCKKKILNPITKSCNHDTKLKWQSLHAISSMQSPNSVNNNTVLL